MSLKRVPDLVSPVKHFSQKLMVKLQANSMIPNTFNAK